MFNRILSLVLTGSMILTMATAPSALANNVSQSGANSFSCGAPSFGTAKSFGLGGVEKGPFSVVVGDFNGDDKADLAVANVDGDLSILLGDGMGGFGAARNITLGDQLISIAAGDLNGDGKLDLVVGSFDSGHVGVVFGDGTGGFGGEKIFQVGGVAGFVSLGDLNGDGKLDLVVGNDVDVAVLLGDGAGNFGAATHLTAGKEPIDTVVRDLNGDGKLDLVVANAASNNVSVLLGDGMGGFGAATNFGVESAPFSIAVEDFNRDGKLDLAVVNVDSGNLSVLLGNGLGGFGAAMNFSAGLIPASVVAGDFNADGKMDLAVADTDSPNVSVLLGDGAGGFGPVTNFSIGNESFFIAIGDFNEDSKIDLVTANPMFDNVSLFLNTCSGAPGLAMTSAASYSGSRLASESIAAVFGASLATGAQFATSTPLPTSLAGTTIGIKDSAGAERLAPLFYVSPTQANCQIPPGTVIGQASIKITSGDGSVVTGLTQISSVAPALFSANANGQGVAAAVTLRIRADGSQIYEPIAQFDTAQNRFVSIPIDLGPDTDTVFLILYGSGVRFHSSLTAAQASIGGVSAQAEYAGPAPGFVGLDQINLRLPRSLAGRGEDDITLIVDGRRANTVRVNVK